MCSCPYNPNHPAVKYYGLTEELGHVLEGVLAPLPVPLLIVGGHRMGRTSFLWEIERQLDRDRDTQAVYVDLGSLPYHPEPIHLFHRIARAASYALTGGTGEVGSHLEGFSDEIESFDQLVGFIIATADRQSVGRVVIMLDELELLRKATWLATVLRNFRAIMADRERGGHLAFLATALREDLEMEITDFGEPVMRFETVSLRTLRKLEFRELVREPIEEPKHRLSEEIENRIWEETGGHPYLVHWFMYELWNMHQGNLSRSNDEDMSVIAQKPPREYFRYLYGTYFGLLERELYRMLMETSGGLSQRGIQDRLIAPGPEIDLSLRVLEQSGVVQREDDHYVCNGQMFKGWFAIQVRYLRPSTSRDIQPSVD